MDIIIKCIIIIIRIGHVHFFCTITHQYWRRVFSSSMNIIHIKWFFYTDFDVWNVSKCTYTESISCYMRFVPIWYKTAIAVLFNCSAELRHDQNTIFIKLQSDNIRMLFYIKVIFELINYKLRIPGELSNRVE